MSFRLVEVIVPEASEGAIDTTLDDQPTLARWRTPIDEERVRFTVLLGGEGLETVVEALEERIKDIADARVILMPVEATIPRPEDEVKEAEETVPRTPREAAEAEEAKEAAEASGKSGRLSTAELYQDAVEMSELTAPYVGLVLLSTIVAALGMWDGSIIAIIGAMVIAPLIGPNVGLSMATTLADVDLARRAVVTAVIGAVAALAASLALGIVLPVGPETGEIPGRTVLGFQDIGLALAAGGAAVLSLTIGVSTALVGVMVAVALLPPLVAAGLLLGGGYVDAGIGAALLATSNVICINLAGVLTFIVQGVRPNTYWEAERARRATIVAVGIWVILLVLLVVVWQVTGLGAPPTPSLP